MLTTEEATTCMSVEDLKSRVPLINQGKFF